MQSFAESPPSRSGPLYCGARARRLQSARAETMIIRALSMIAALCLASACQRAAPATTAPQPRNPSALCERAMSAELVEACRLSFDIPPSPQLGP